MANKINCLVELDYCVGCYACQSACQGINELPVKETYLRTVLLKPEKTEGVMHCFMCPIPYELDKCSECIDREGESPCSKICIGKALHFGTEEEIAQAKKEASGRTVVFA